MSVRSGHTTTRNVMESYNGFTIIKVTNIEHERDIFNPSRYSKWPKSREVHYDFCKDGNENKPSQHYEAWAKNVSECKKCIDDFINDDSTYFTAEEREKYVYKPNKKCSWAYGYTSLMKLLKEHQQASKRMKILIEDRLTDANFHTESSLLSDGNYDKFVEHVKNTYKFREKFEIYTETECKRIKDPKQFEEGLAKVIEDYLTAQGVNDTTAKVQFIENW